MINSEKEGKGWEKFLQIAVALSLEPEMSFKAKGCQFMIGNRVSPCEISQEIFPGTPCF